jgi:large subunit ribosomal protein L2
LINIFANNLKFKGKKPKNRGVARNPVDHPHGGRTKTNSPEVSPWG